MICGRFRAVSMWAGLCVGERKRGEGVGVGEGEGGRGREGGKGNSCCAHVQTCEYALATVCVCMRLGDMLHVLY